jgi:hypothetical protein
LQLDVLITDATIDAYDESEQRMGFYTMIMDHLSVPFETTTLGVPVVHSIEERVRLLDQKKAARRDRKRLRRETAP